MRFRKVWMSLAITGLVCTQLSAGATLTFAAGEQSTADIAVNVNGGSDGNTVQASAAAPSLTLLSEQILTSGAVQHKISWKSTRNGKAVSSDVNVIEIDLQNPNVKLDVMTGTGNQFTHNQTVLGMVKENHAVAGVNGDFFNLNAEGVPIGPQISNGQLMATPPYLPGLYSFAITGENQPVLDTFVFDGNITAPDGTSYPLGGINKTYYWYENGDPKPPTPVSDTLKGVHSMTDGLYMYTEAWGQVNRSNDGMTVPTEVLVVNDIVTQIAKNTYLDMLPPKNGYILRASGKAADFMLNHFKVGDPILANYQVLSSDPTKQYDASKFKMMIGGGTILVDNGKASKFTRPDTSPNSGRSRTGIGYSRDGKYVYLITVDFSGSSMGMTMTEFQQFMIQIGVWRGMNLDGGGSTQMAVRPLGEFTQVLTNKTEYGVSRQVVNGLGVFSTAPVGQLAGLIVSGQQTVFVNEHTNYTTKAFDNFYNPLLPEGLSDLKWSSSAALGTFENNTFTAIAPGNTNIVVSSGDVSQEYPIEVVGRDQIASMKIDAPDYILSEGFSYKLSVLVTTRSGKQRYLPANLVQWEINGVEGEMKDGVLTVKRIKGNVGQLIASYDGISTMLSLPLGQYKLWQDFAPKNIHQMITFGNSPKEVTGYVRLMKGENGLAEDDQALQLNYDFTKGSGTKAGYIVFGDIAKGVAVSGQPVQMKLDVLGDNSRHWLRMEVLDKNGKTQRIDLATAVNWTGWKTVYVNLSDYKLAYPISVQRIYMASIEQGQQDRPQTGMIAIDNLYFQAPPKIENSPKIKLKMNLNQTAYTVNGEKRTMDPAPYSVNGSSLIPIHFVIDAMGGVVRWDGTERKVTILRDSHLIELWVDNREMIVDGTRVTAPVAPVIKNNRTMVPLKIIGISLGWAVSWDPKTMGITLE